MVRKSQLESPEFILTPAAPLELVLKGMKTAEADLTARLSRQRNEDAKAAGLMKKLGKAQLEVMSKSGVDVGALAREVRQLRRQRAPKQAFPELLQSKVPVGLAVPSYSVVRHTAGAGRHRGIMSIMPLPLLPHYRIMPTLKLGPWASTTTLATDSK
jgi:hypothetical protein